MARKIRIRVTTIEAVNALRDARERLAEVGRWPRKLGESPISVLDDQIGIADEEFELVDEVVSDIHGFGVDVYELEDGLEVAIDLPAVFDRTRRDATILAGLIRDLLKRVRNLVAHEVTVYVGVGKDTPAKALAELRRAAREHRIKLPSAATAAQADDGDEADEASEEGVDFDDDSVDDKDTGGSSTGNQWGGLDDAAAADAPLSDSEHFFLKCTGLTWPCSPGLLKAEFRRVAQLTHPDKQPGNAADKATAEAMFKQMKEGHESLARRLST